MAKVFRTQLAVLDPAQRYTGAMASGNITMDFAGEALPNLRGSQLFAYLFRRFGYPNANWAHGDAHSRYLLTTPRNDVFLDVFPSFSGDDLQEGGEAQQALYIRNATMMMGFWVTQAVSSALEREYFLMMEAWIKKVRHIPKNRRAAYPDPTEHPLADTVSNALKAAILDLRRPVYVRDCLISCYGTHLPDTRLSVVDPAPIAGQRIPPEMLSDPQAFRDLITALKQWGDGDMQAGIAAVIRQAPKTPEA